MLKRVIVTMIVSILFTISAYGSNTTAEITHKDDLLKQFEEILVNNPASQIKYTTAIVNIRSLPNKDAEITSQIQAGTQLQVIAEIEGWAMIHGENGYAYIEAELLSNNPVKSYTEEDLRILAMILCGECQNYPDQEQRLVGSVFLNRVKSNQYPNTFQGVAADRRYGIQYACWYDGNAFRQIQQSNWDNAKWLLENGSILPDHVLFQSRKAIGKVYMKTKWHYYCY